MAKQVKIALITGITGQDGSYLAEFLLKKGYIVHGLMRRASTFNIERIKHLMNYPRRKDGKLFLHYGDLSDASSINAVIVKTKPDEIYNLGAQSHVWVSFEIPEYTADVNGLGTLRMLEAMRYFAPNAKFYQASSSEMYGGVGKALQNEKTPLTRKARMQLPKFLPTKPPAAIAMLTDYLLPAVFYLIMNRQGGAKILLQKKLFRAWLE